MQKIAFFNAGPQARYVGGVLVPPNEARQVDPRCLPRDERPAGCNQQAPADAAPPTVAEALTALISAKVSDITATLPGLSADQLDELEALEAAGKNRVSLIKSITEERLRRAGAGQGDGEGAGAGEE